VLTFCYYFKYLRQSTFKEKRFILAHNFRGSSPWLGDTISFGPVVKQHFMVRSMWQCKARYLMV
jgi:hypothetical protein